MFNILREHITLISAISYQEPGLPRFCWDMSMSVLSIDGYAIPLARIRQAIHSAIEAIERGLDALFGSCTYQDVLRYIDSHLDPNPDQWFHDRPQDYTYGVSLFNNQQNGLEQHQHRLLTHMVSDEMYFTATSAGPSARKGTAQTVEKGWRIY
jgi:hypothetical protein